MRTVLLFVALAGLASCVRTSLQSPKALPQGKQSFGLHGASLIHEDVDDNLAVFTGTYRRGMESGELGINAGTLGSELSYKLPLTERTAKTHLSLIGTAGLYAWIFPEVSAGVLLGQELGPALIYAGHRNIANVMLDAGSMYANASVGARVKIADSVSLSVEFNHSYIAFPDETNCIDEFELGNVAAVGLIFGGE